MKQKYLFLHLLMSFVLIQASDNKIDKELVEELSFEELQTKLADGVNYKDTNIVNYIFASNKYKLRFKTPERIEYDNGWCGDPSNYPFSIRYAGYDYIEHVAFDGNDITALAPNRCDNRLIKSWAFRWNLFTGKCTARRYQPERNREKQLNAQTKDDLTAQVTSNREGDLQQQHTIEVILPKSYLIKALNTYQPEPTFWQRITCRKSAKKSSEKRN